MITPPGSFLHPVALSYIVRGSRVVYGEIIAPK